MKVGNDAAPEFSAQTLPAGTAPADRTFQPNPINETPGQANNPDTLRAHGKESTYTDPLASIPGATSADVHTGLGHPGQGQVASDSKTGGGRGIQGTTAAGIPSQMADEREQVSQRGLERESGGMAGKNDPRDYPGAEERVPESAESVASEMSGRERMDRGT